MTTPGLIVRPVSPAGALAFTAEQDGRQAGYLTARPIEWRLVQLDATTPGHGVGSRLLQAALDAAGPDVRWTTLVAEDNDGARRFYVERHGFVVCGATERHLVLERPAG